MRSTYFAGAIVVLVAMAGPALAKPRARVFSEHDSAIGSPAGYTQLAHGGGWQAIGCFSSEHACHDHAHEHGYSYSRLVHDHDACEDHPHLLCLGRN